jgi:hypothetical protein
VQGESDFVGVSGVGNYGSGVYGESHSPSNIGGAGVAGKGFVSTPGVYGESESGPGLLAVSGSTGVWGRSTNREFGAAGVYGESPYVGVKGVGRDASGVYGESTSTIGGAGIAGKSFATTPGVYGESETGTGVSGAGNIGVFGRGITSSGVEGYADGGRGVAGFSKSGQGVYGHSGGQVGVFGESENFDGVFGVSHNPAHAGVSGHNPNGLAGYFDGNVGVTGDIQLVGSGDCAEEFGVSGLDAAPGTVMVIDQDGQLLPSQYPYDKKVAGVVSGAGGYRPGLILDKRPQQQKGIPIALVGKVYCKVDAQYSPVEVGDLLTTSSTPGCAMKAVDPSRAFGAVIGKALRGQKEGCGLIPILVALQ